MRTVALLVGMIALALGVPAKGADDVAQRLARLEARVAALEAEAEALRSQAQAALADANAARAELAAADKDPTAALEIGANAAQPAPAEDAYAAAPPSGDGNANAFNPAISIILDGRWGSRSLSPEDYVRSGFPLVGEGAPGDEGLALGESEIAFAANIDDKFYGQITLAFESEDGETEAAIEEAYIETIALPAGWTLRAGRFFSNIGYLNSHHAHTDSFVDRPLAYQAFLGNQLGDDGAQLRWVAPTDFYLELGGELLRGDGYPAGGASGAGAGAFTLFAHAGGDVGLEHEWLAGLSLLDFEADGSEDGFSGDGQLLVADLTWKWAPNGNTRDGGITLRGEAFRDDRDGRLAQLGGTAACDKRVRQDAERGCRMDAGLDSALWYTTRRGAYVETVWRINRTWDAGVRYDRLWADDQGPFASTFDPRRASLMATWRPSEFSLVRAQYSRDEPNEIDEDDVFWLQYQMSLGAHGAHKF